MHESIQRGLIDIISSKMILILHFHVWNDPIKENNLLMATSMQQINCETLQKKKNSPNPQYDFHWQTFHMVNASKMETSSSYSHEISCLNNFTSWRKDEILRDYVYM